MAVKLPCAVCFTANKNYVLLSESETETVEKNFVDFLDPSIKIVRFVNEADESSFCYSCFDSSIRFKKLKERLSKLQTEISVWSSVISKQILDRRNQNHTVEATDVQTILSTPYYSSDDEDARLNANTRSYVDSAVAKRIKIEVSSDCEEDDTTMKELQRKAETKNRNCNLKKKNANISIFQVDYHNENYDDTVIATPNFEQTLEICPKIEITFPNDNGCEEDDFLNDITICTEESEPEDTSSMVTLPSTQVVVSPVITNQPKTRIVDCNTKRKISERKAIGRAEAGILEKKKKNSGKNKRQRSANVKVNQPKVYNKDNKRSRPFLCSFCSQAFHTQSGSTIHERIHTGVKPFKCPFCERDFNVKCNLKVHLRIHTGERPFKCSFCERTFTQLGSFQDHERRHTGVKQYQCTFCQTPFNTSTQLKFHKLTHAEKKTGRSVGNHKL